MNDDKRRPWATVSDDLRAQGTPRADELAARIERENRAYGEGGGGDSNRGCAIAALALLTGGALAGLLIFSTTLTSSADERKADEQYGQFYAAKRK